MIRTFVLAATVVAASTAMAAPFAHVANANWTIDYVNMSTNGGSFYNNTIGAFDSLAITNAGVLYAADQAGVIWNTTGAPIPAGPTGRTQIGDLDYANGGLWGFSNATSELFFFDLALSTVTYSQFIPINPGLTVSGVAHQTSTGDIYLSAYNSSFTSFLMMVPFMGVAANPIGQIVHGDGNSYVSDVDFDASGTLYALTWFHRHFYSVSTSTAATNLVSVGPHRDSNAMAINSVPEPATFAVLGLGLAAVARRRKQAAFQ